MKQSIRKGLNYMAAHPKYEMSGNGHTHHWYEDKSKVRTAAGIAGFVIGSLLTVMLVKRSSKVKKR